jgi:hypothetical protein
MRITSLPKNGPSFDVWQTLKLLLPATGNFKRTSQLPKKYFAPLTAALRIGGWTTYRPIIEQTMGAMHP